MRIVYFGSSSFGLPCLEAIHQSEHELAGVFTQPARPAGRHRSHLTPTDVAQWCQQNHIDCTEAKNINTPDMVERVAACRADLLVVIAFGQKISQTVIGLHSRGAINVHASLLPKYRGAAPIHWAIMNGETETGVSIITLADEMDAGDVLAQGTTAVEPNDTFETMHEKLSQLSVAVLMNTIDQIQNGSATYTPQEPAQVTYAPKLKKTDGYINWDKSADAIVNHIRGLWPWPGAQSIYVSAETGKTWRVGLVSAAAVERKDTGALPGRLDEQLMVTCGSGSLRINEIKPSGSHRMDFEAFLNGHKCRPGDLFISAEKAMNGIFNTPQGNQFTRETS